MKSLSKKSKSLDKQQRRHQAKQIRKNKRVEVLEKKRKIGTENSAPHVIVSISEFKLMKCVLCAYIQCV